VAGFLLSLRAHIAFVLANVNFLTPLKLSLKRCPYINIAVALPIRGRLRGPQPTLAYTLTGQREKFGHVTFTC
jgi:hypothetical protein